MRLSFRFYGMSVGLHNICSVTVLAIAAATTYPRGAVCTVQLTFGPNQSYPWRYHGLNDMPYGVPKLSSSPAAHGAYPSKNPLHTIASVRVESLENMISDTYVHTWQASCVLP